MKHETGSSDQQAASRVQQRERGEVDFDPPSRGMGIDATMKFKDAKFPPVNKVSSALIDKVAARWDELACRNSGRALLKRHKPCYPAKNGICGGFNGKGCE